MTPHPPASDHAAPTQRTASTASTASTDAARPPRPERPLRWYLGRGISAGLFALALLIALAVVVVPAVSGAQSFTITGDSMTPALPRGTLVVVHPVDPAILRTGDIITFQLESGRPAVATHRVQGFTFVDGERLIVTKGDANSATDTDPVLVEQIRGRLWYSIPVIGWVNAVLTGPTRAWLVPAAAAALALYGTWMLVTGIRDARRSRRAGARDPSRTRRTRRTRRPGTHTSGSPTLPAASAPSPPAAAALAPPTTPPTAAGLTSPTDPPAG